MRQVAFFTLGCKVNQYETEAMAELFESFGYEQVKFSEKSDIYIINTCTVTAVADRKSRQAIRRAKHINPLAIVVVTGCYAQVNPDEASKIEGVDLVIGNSGKKDIVNLIETFNGENKLIISDISNQKAFDNIAVNVHKGKTRAFMKIQDGCNNYCSYCIIPYARGPIRSRNTEDILLEAVRLSANNYKEIVLTGIHLASYGMDDKCEDLLDILFMLHKVDGINRIRLGSLELTKVLEKIAQNHKLLPLLCDHFHISLQSGCDATLSRMNRRYNTNDYKKSVHMIRQAWPDASITTDIMVGFPGETDEEFEKSLKFSEEIAFTKIHVFPYSPREGTKAAIMNDQIPQNIKRERANLMQQLADKLENDFYKHQIGRDTLVLFEQNNLLEWSEGHTTNFLRVKIKNDNNLSNQIIRVKIIDLNDGILIGEKI